MNVSFSGSQVKACAYHFLAELVDASFPKGILWIACEERHLFIKLHSIAQASPEGLVSIRVKSLNCLFIKFIEKIESRSLSFERKGLGIGYPHHQRIP